MRQPKRRLCSCSGRFRVAVNAELFHASCFCSTLPTMSKIDGTVVLGYCMRELAGLTNHLVGAIVQAQQTGTLPDATFGDLAGDTNNATVKPAKSTAKKAKATTASGQAKKPRQLTAFNWYVKAQIEDMRKNNVTPTKDADGKVVNLMTMAGARWKLLGAEGQAEFTKKFRVQLPS